MHFVFAKSEVSAIRVVPLANRKKCEFGILVSLANLKLFENDARREVVGKQHCMGPPTITRVAFVGFFKRVGAESVI